MADSLGDGSEGGNSITFLNNFSFMRIKSLNEAVVYGKRGYEVLLLWWASSLPFVTPPKLGLHFPRQGLPFT